MAEQEASAVFLLWHCRPLDDRLTAPDTDDKLIGVFGSEEAAEAAKRQVSDQPGFRDWPDAFEISGHVLGRLGWTEGFISGDEASKRL